MVLVNRRCNMSCDWDSESNYSKWRDPYWYMAMAVVFTLASLIVYAVI
jgi:hypothetical protein